MTGVAQAHTGASTASSDKWNAIDWQTAKTSVHRLQMRIAKAFCAKQYGKVKALQWLLTHSYYAKCLAVKRVTQNKGAKTPGVDQVVWKSLKQKMQAVQLLKRRGYQPSPLRRIYIPKKAKGELRPLSIPVMQCRAMQALYLFALEPIAENSADRNAYGFRPLRSAHDAIARCQGIFVRRGSAPYILEADIKSCFSSISHSWLLENILMDKRMLKSWLQAGYIEDGKTYPTNRGTPQGGTISATLLVMTLSGLEQAVKSVVKNRKKNKVYFSIYADDCVPRAQKEVTLCQRCKGTFVCNCMRDGSRSSEIALQEEISNHSKLRWLRVKVVSVREKVSYKASGVGQGDEAIKPLLKCRKRIDEIKTEWGSLTRDKHNGNLFTGYAISGMKVA